MGEPCSFRPFRYTFSRLSPIPRPELVFLHSISAAPPLACTPQVTAHSRALFTGPGLLVALFSWLTARLPSSQVVLLPVVSGSLLSKAFPRTIAALGPYSALFAVLTVALIVGSGISSSAAPLIHTSTFTPQLFLSLVLSVFLLHSTGFLLGYVIPRKLLGLPESESRTISIEVGMQVGCCAPSRVSMRPFQLLTMMQSCISAPLSCAHRSCIICKFNDFALEAFAPLRRIPSSVLCSPLATSHHPW